MHVLTAMCWYGLRTAESLDGHCGYDFSWSPYRFVPFSGGSAYHDFHHSSNVGNYSSWFCIMDTVFGTNKDFYDQIKKNV
jgi:sterol desaturase/sphingolipid hydroxylase (fatty acid hydroxylase superfamily)